VNRPVEGQIAAEQQLSAEQQDQARLGIPYRIASGAIW
jgi:hypothetical protein